MVCHSSAEMKNLFFNEASVKKKFVFMSFCLKNIPNGLSFFC